jgi:hypothetical protein
MCELCCSSRQNLTFFDCFLSPKYCLAGCLYFIWFLAAIRQHGFDLAVQVDGPLHVTLGV